MKRIKGFRGSRGENIKVQNEEERNRKGILMFKKSWRGNKEGFSVEICTCCLSDSSLSWGIGLTYADTVHGCHPKLALNPQAQAHYNDTCHLARHRIRY